MFAMPMLAGMPREAQNSFGRQLPHSSRHGGPSEFAALVCPVVEAPMLHGEVIRLGDAIRMAPLSA